MLDHNDIKQLVDKENGIIGFANGSEVCNVEVQRNKNYNSFYFKFNLIILILRVDLTFYTIK